MWSGRKKARRKLRSNSFPARQEQVEKSSLARSMPPSSLVLALTASRHRTHWANKPIILFKKMVLSFVLQCSTLNMIILLRSIETYLQGFFYHILRSSYHPRNNFGKTLDSWWTIYETFMNNH